MVNELTAPSIDSKPDIRLAVDQVLACSRPSLRRGVGVNLLNYLEPSAIEALVARLI
jgi:hypothetical protein